MKSKKDFTNSVLPKARISDIVVQDVADETLVYDLRNDKAHHLNKTSTVVWQNCNGETTYGELLEKLNNELKSEIDSDFIWLALNELEKINLLERDFEKSPFTNLTRREVVVKYGLAAVTVPLIVSLVTPVSAQMGSCLPVESPCDFTMGTPCCPPATCVAPFGSNSSGTCEVIIN